MMTTFNTGSNHDCTHNKTNIINSRHFTYLLRQQCYLLLLLSCTILDSNCWSSISIHHRLHKYNNNNNNNNNNNKKLCCNNIIQQSNPITLSPTVTKILFDDKVYVHHLTSTSLCMNKDDEDDIDDEDDDDDDDDEVIQQTKNGSGMTTASNVIGTNLCECCSNVRNTGIGTGYYRNGYCSTGDNDIGRHTVCVEVTTEFLDYSKNVGNDLSTPMIEYMFPGLQHGDKWCLCAERWVQAYNAGVAPKLLLQSTHEKTLSYISYDILQQYALDQTIATNELDKLNTIRDKLNKLL